jgi:hypothetical protein
MNKIKDLLEFKKEIFFDGAVQADWFYNEEMREKTSKSFIFHGPKYYGVNQSDISMTSHQLIDTASYTKKIYEKLYKDYESSRFMLTIAGYGAGKSHLSVTIAALLSGVDESLRKAISDKLVLVDEEIGTEVKGKSEKNLVLVINGMNDFNLNNEILKNASRTLELFGLDNSIFKDMTLAYETAYKFLQTTFDSFKNSYMYYASKYAKYKRASEIEIKNLLGTSVFDDNEAYEIINEVYKEVTGNYIKWEEGISAATVLTKLHNTYVKEKKLFKNVVIIFDEFGRYLEYAAAHPNLAGESAIQQIFESVQNCKPSMIFIGFIQSDLSAYLSRVSNQNIARYVGRYENSDKYYLSSNLETVLANLVKKKNSNAEVIIDNIFNNTMKNYSSRLFENMNRWISESSSKSVWSNKNLFNNTIVRGCYPIHPMTVSLLSSLSTWMQQRSSLSFVGEIFSQYDNEVISQECIPYIYPTSIINSRLFNELINAEEKGRQQGQYCTLFNEVLSNFNEKLTEDDKNVLRAILIINISKYKTFDKNDNISALVYNTGILKNEVVNIIKNLENQLGIIYFDETINRYAFMTESNSKVDFNREFVRKRLRIHSEGLFTTIDEEIKRELKLDCIEETAFGIMHDITTGEWSFNKSIIEIEEFDNRYAIDLKRRFREAIHPDSPKGNIIFLYCLKDNYDYVKNVIEIFKSHELDKEVVLIYLIYDDENIIKESLLDIKTLNTFTVDENKRFKRYIDASYKGYLKRIIRKFQEIGRSRNMISSEGVVVAEGKIKDMCTSKLESIYKTTIPYVFDGFEKKVTPTVRRRFNQVAIAMINKTITRESEFNSLESDLKNRIKSVLYINNKSSWKVLLDNFVLVEPNNLNVKIIYDEILEELKSRDSIIVKHLIGKYMYPPYGVNIYCLTLLLIYFITYNSKSIEIIDDGNRIKSNALVNFFNDDKKEIVQNILKLKVSFKENISDNVVKDFIDEVNRNTKIENCEVLLEKAREIKEDEYITDDLRGVFVNLESQLNIGVEANRKIYKELEEASKVYSEAFENSFKPYKYIRINGYIGNVIEGKISRTNYYYSAEYLDKVNKIKNYSIDKIIGQLEQYLDRININESNFENFKRNNKQLLLILKRNCAVEFVERMQNKITTIEKKFKEKSNYEPILKKCDFELEQCQRYMQKYENINQVERMIEEWEKFFNNNILSEDIKTDYINKLNNSKSLLKLKHEELNGDVEKAIIEAYNLKDLAQVKAYRRQLEQLLSKGVPKNHKDRINDVIFLIDDLVESISDLDKNQLNKIYLENAFKIIKKDYESTCLKNVTEKIFEDKMNTVFLNEENWKQKYIKSMNEYKSMEPSQLLQWKNQTEFKPYYLTEETLLEYEIVLGVVNEKLSYYKIDNIIQLFIGLDENQKLECLEKLKSL